MMGKIVSMITELSFCKPFFYRDRVREFPALLASKKKTALQAEGSQGAIDDGGTGTATFTVTCNAAGTAWEAMGLMVTAVECSAVPGENRFTIFLLELHQNPAILLYLSLSPM